MKIAFLSFYSGYIPRGIETYVHELANQLVENHEVTVYQSGPKLANAKYKTIMVETGADWKRINELRHLSTLIFFDFSFKNLLRRFYLDYWSRVQGKFAVKTLTLLSTDTDVIISASSGWISILIRLWCFKHKIKLIIPGQSGPGWDDRINLFCRPNVFVTLTKYQADWANKNGFGVKTAVIPNGVDLKRFNPKVEKIKINLPRPIFICVAALEPGKRIEFVIKAVSKLKQASLLVLGQGKLKNQLEEMASHYLPNRFAILSVPHDKIPPYYCSCDALTMVPPLTESFGIVFLEAMACNKTVVTSDDPPRREIVGDAGLFVDPRNSDEYAAALERALDKNWGDIPRKQAEKFSWDKIAEKYDQLFRNLTGL